MFLSNLWRGFSQRCRFCGEESWTYATGIKPPPIPICRSCWGALEALGAVRDEVIPG